MNIAHMRSSVLLLSLVASSVFASPFVNIGTALETVAIGDSVDIPITLNTDGDVQTLNFDFTFDDVQFTATESCVARLPNSLNDPFSQNSVACNVSGNTVSVVVSPVVQAIPPTLTAGALDMGFISFQSKITTPIGPYPLPIGTEVYGGADGAIPPAGSTDGLITVVLGPQPAYGSSPQPDTTLDAGTWIQNQGPAEALLTINNNNGEDGSDLSGECEITEDLDSVFTIKSSADDGPVAFGPIAKGDTSPLSVVCDTTAAFDTYAGTLTCTHDGATSWTSPVSYPLACTVTDGPQPNYSDTLSPDPMDLVAVEQSDPDPTGTLTISNAGGARDMTVTCSYTGDTEISLAQDGVQVVIPVDGAFPFGVACDASAENSYTGSISCAHDAKNVASPVVYPASCEVGPPGDAVYESDPISGDTIEMTPPGDPAIEDSVVQDQPLEITNAAESNDRELALMNCAFSGSDAITATAVTTPLAPGASSTVMFSCDTEFSGDFTGTYSCGYDQDGNGEEDEGSPATYTVNCGVREPESEVDENPASGRTVTIVAAPGDAGFASVSFDEILDEGADATLLDCSFDDDTYHRIVSPTSYPVAIPSGGSLRVELEGTGPDDVDSVTTMLRCTYSDVGEDGEQEVDVSWPVEIVVQVYAIPTLSAWSLMAMILTLMGLGGMVIRRKMLH